MDFALEVYNFLLVACRVGGAIRFLPVLGEDFFPAQIKIAFTLSITFLIYPIISQQIVSTEQSAIFLKFILQETFIGIFIGITIKLVFFAVHTAAIFIATQSGLAFATMYDPTQQEQSTTINALLTIMITTAILVSDMHHIFIRSIIHSYEIFNINHNFDVNEFTQAIIIVIRLSFTVAFQISAPFFVIHLLITICNGILAKLMPSFQVFFVMTPLQVLVSYIIILYTINSTIDILLDAINQSAMAFW